MKKILKGILLWVTVLSAMLFISGIDSIINANLFLPWLAICSLLIVICYLIMSIRDLYTLLGYNLLTKLLIKK